MGFTEILTIVFVLLKIFEVIDWSWWIVFLPEIIALTIYIICIVVQVIAITKTHKRVNKHFDRFHDDF